MSSQVNVSEEEASYKLVRKISDSSTSSYVAVMGQSLDHPMSFKETDSQVDQSLIHRAKKESYLSMRSDQNVDEPDDLQQENILTDWRKRSNFSSLSMKSDQSIDCPYNFRSGDDQADRRLIQRKRSNFSSLSMKSDQSIDCPYNFRSGDDQADRSIQWKRSALSRANTLDHIFKKAEERAMSLVKNELMRFKNLLSPDSSAEEVLNEDVQVVREGALKITLHVLREMDHVNLATVLQSKMTPWYLQKFKSNLKKTYQSIREGTAKQQNSTLLNEIYTDLYLTEGGCDEVRYDHEMRQVEEISRKVEKENTAMNVNKIFKAFPGQDKSIRTVLTKGIAGIGKTVSVQKFILDWSEGVANKDVHFIFPLPFRELNILRGKAFSLKDLLRHFFPEMADLALTGCDAFKILFIFDGLDESRLPLDFHNNPRVCNVAKRTSVDVLLTNLIQGNLLPSALLWITSRPAACGQIPPQCVDLVTEVRGFSDLQKEEYFRRRISDRSLANRIIAHMKSFRSLYVMCHIPVFCWIAATVLEKVLSQAKSGEMPKTLTQMFSHFVNFQMTQRTQRYHGTYKPDADQIQESVLALGKLAYEQLEKGNLVFYEEDLSECDIDAREMSVYSGLCTQMFREEIGLQMGRVFSFVHLSIQEFLAALYVLLSFIISSSRKDFDKKIPGFLSSIHKPAMSDLLKKAVDKSLQSENGHLDLFLRFLLGLSLESNQTLLTGLQIQTGHRSHKEETAKYIKKVIREISSPEKSINLFHCLNELNDHSLEQEVQVYLSRRAKNRLSNASLSPASLTPAQWSALVFVLLNSEEELDEFNLCNYDPSEECFKKLLPVVKASRTANLNGCNLTEQSCALLASALSSNSSVRQLDLSTNNLHDSGVKLLSAGLENPQCKLQRLRLCGCRITEKSCLTLAFTLASNFSHLIELNLANNNLQDSGVKLLCEGLEKPHCKLETLGLCNCNLTHEGCAVLVGALKSNPSHLRELNLGMNKLGDLGVKQLSCLLEEPSCKLEKLELFDCNITEEGCAALASALKSNPSHLRELDLDHNEAGQSGEKLLSSLLEDPDVILK
ncbi:NACHT, LRR and PYD domains-containing protein 3-like [Salminus brasiliensis]|uniref:NACHT, LRR and PYD domains-containing protein 3-like n=1 Tax=Salminus brasiliensis TaxID=930266 RepID=UPI003B838A2B